MSQCDPSTHGQNDSTDDRGRRRSTSVETPLIHGSPAQQKAVYEIQQSLQVSLEQLKACAQEFGQEMQAGLAEDSPTGESLRNNDLKMIPSYVTGMVTLTEREIHSYVIYFLKDTQRGMRKELILHWRLVVSTFMCVKSSSKEREAN